MIGSVQHQQMQAILAAASSATQNKGGQNLPLSAMQADSVSSSSVITNFEVAESLSGIARKYDTRNMSPREMSEMSQELYQGGTISFQDHALLSFQPELGSAPTEVSMNQADTPRDFIAHWEQQLKFHEQQGESSFAKNDRRILNLLSNLDAISQPDNA